MTISLQQMRDRGIILELAECFSTEPAALALLSKTGVKSAFFRPFGSMTTVEWWDAVCAEIEHGILANGLKDLLKKYPDEDEINNT